MKQKACSRYKDCQHGNSGCYASTPETCVRFLPLKSTHLTTITGTVETPPEIDDDKFNQYFINWIESMGWKFNGIISPHEQLSLADIVKQYTKR